MKLLIVLTLLAPLCGCPKLSTNPYGTGVYSPYGFLYPSATGVNQYGFPTYAPRRRETVITDCKRNMYSPFDEFTCTSR